MHTLPDLVHLVTLLGSGLSAAAALVRTLARELRPLWGLQAEIDSLKSRVTRLEAVRSAPLAPGLPPGYSTE